MKIAMIQMQSSAFLEKNLEKMEGFCEKAKAGNADLVIFPEMAYWSGKKEKLASVIEAYPRMISLMSSWARKYEMGIIPGTLREPVPYDQNRFYNTLPFFDETGKLVATYRKIFRFKAHLPHHHYDETRFCEAGKNPVLAEFKGFKLGFGICFDLRFPEIFRVLRGKGAQVFILPSAFTVPTGQAHWEILLRARAIENQAYVVASDQTGLSGEGLEQYGHSLAVGPWGEILTRMGTEEGLQFIDLNPQALKTAEEKMAVFPISQAHVTIS